MAIPSKTSSVDDYLYVEDSSGILACVQMGSIEFHAWGCHKDRVEKPDRMVFDLDPDSGVDFQQVKKAAIDVRAHLQAMGLQSFAMVTGGKGLHVIVPLDVGHSWEEHKDFAKRFAQALSMSEPDRFVATMSKAKRKNKIFIDYLRNQRGSTAIITYSLRARANAPVAAPISWGELATVESPTRWTIKDHAELIKRSRSAKLKGWGQASQKIPLIK